MPSPALLTVRPSHAVLVLGLLAALIVAAGAAALIPLVRWGLQRESLARLDPSGANLVAPRIAALVGGEAVLIGDSRLAAIALSEAIEGCAVVNLAVPGATSAQSLLLLEQALKRSSPSIVVIQVGVNDLKAAGFGGDRAALLSGVQRNLDAMTDLARRSGSKVLLTAILPVDAPPLIRRPFWPRDFPELIRSANASLEALASPSEGVFFWSAEQDWTFSDSLHLDDNSNRILGERLSVEIARRLGPPAERSP